jgi:hypothetical protein
MDLARAQCVCVEAKARPRNFAARRCRIHRNWGVEGEDFLDRITEFSRNYPFVLYWRTISVLACLVFKNFMTILIGEMYTLKNVGIKEAQRDFISLP